MAEVIDLAGRRPRVEWTVDISQDWEGALEVRVRDVADSPQDRRRAAHALLRAALLLCGNAHQMREWLLAELQLRDGRPVPRSEREEYLESAIRGAQIALGRDEDVVGAMRILVATRVQDPG